MVLVPVCVVFASFLSPDDEIWQHLISTTLPSLLTNTLWLSLGVIVGTSLLGVSLAWFTSVYRFPGYRFFSWALFLPLAIPAYVIAFVALGTFDYTGPVQTSLRHWFNSDLLWFPDIRSGPGVAIVMTLAFYPYVYLLSRDAFLTQGKRLLEVAQSLGFTRQQGFFRVVLPMARPWIVAGIMLALMETLADFGTVSIFNYDTFTTAIYKTWFGMFSLSTASQLASLLILIVLVIIMTEQRFRLRMRFSESRKSARVERIPLTGWQAMAVTGFAGTVLFFAFALPIIQLGIWAMDALTIGLDQRYLEFAWHSILLSVLAALITCLVAAMLAYAARLHSDGYTRFAIRLTTVGYALPGAVLAVGIFIPMAWLDNLLSDWIENISGVETGLLIQGTLTVMLVAYMTRFLAVSYFPLESALQRVTRSIDEAAAGFGVTGWSMLRMIYFPMLKSSLFTAATLVFVDVMKEMPITLMTRPFDWDTLAVRIFSLTSEGQWDQAALPALTLILTGLIPIILLIRHSET
ncbi:ABC transporter permease [Nitrosomonas europaea]|uniref:Iron transport system permease protein n=1 Tax=Nitrosomonas europaea (strain ATCC 19718 / CIP 103999 / KCTC 2705 / NBRC 14298) TaxID=228410 RepID=Q82VN6_NITEU|nr:iron transport system permease protein [Nitrosomonas europaea ATCC 19718]